MINSYSAITIVDRSDYNISSIAVWYYLSTSSTTQTGGSWATTPPTWVDSRYYWQKVITTYEDGSTDESKPVCITGAKGNTGGNGVGINSIVNYYLATSASYGITSTTSGWTTPMQPLTSTNKYLWNYEKVVYSNNTSKNTDPVIIGVYGDRGNDGIGITSITEYYILSSSNTGISNATTGWSTTVPTLTAESKYLWNYEKITYTNNSTKSSDARIIGVYGDKGDDGADGVSIISVDVQYYLSTSSTSQTGGSWQTTAPTWVDGKYIWSKTVTTLSNNSTKESKPVCITGGKGSTGATGTGITAIRELYYVNSNKNTVPTKPTSPTALNGWAATTPTWSTGKYIWALSEITYKNPTSYAYTSPVCDNSWEAVNEIQIGGRNLLKGSMTYTWDCNNGEGCVTSKSDIYGGLLQYQTTREWTGVHMNFKSALTRAGIKVGETVTISVMVKASAAVSVPIYLYRHNHASYGYPFGTKNLTNASWTKLSCTFVVNDYSLTSTTARFECGTTTTQTIYWTALKLEKGNKATDWTPAPEDIDGAIETISTTLAGVSSKVDENTNVISNKVWEKYTATAINTYDGNTVKTIRDRLTTAEQTAAGFKNTVEQHFEDTDGNVSNLSTKHEQLVDKFTWLVTSGSSSTSLTLTDRLIQAITSQFIISSPDGTSTIISGGKMKTDAIKSTNYRAGASGSPFSLLGTFLDLSNGAIYTPAFGTDGANNAYISGEVIASSGRIGEENSNSWHIGTVYNDDLQPSAAMIANGDAYIWAGNWTLGVDKISTYNNAEYINCNSVYYDYGVTVPILDTTNAKYVNEKVSQNFLYIRKHASTIPTLENDWEYLFRVTKDGTIYENGTKLSEKYASIDGVSGAYLPLTGGTIRNNLTVSGNLTVNGTLTGTASKAIQLTHSLTMNGKSWNGSADLNIGTIGIGYGGTGKTLWTANGLVYASSASALAQIGVGTSGQILKSNGNAAPSWVNQSSLSVASATSATNDSAGNNISTYYMPLSGGIFTGEVEFNQTTTFNNTLYSDSSQIGTLLVTGSSRFVNGLIGNLKGDVTGNLVGTASSAVALTTSAGSATQPVYFSGGKPVTTTYTLGKSVPSNAVFTDTNTAVSQSVSTTTNFRPLLLGYTSSTDTSALTAACTNVAYAGAGIYAQPSSGTIYATNYVGKVNGYTISKSVPSNAVFTDTTYTHPSHTAYTSGLYKITTNALGHVTAATAVVKADITGLGIPAQDTTYADVTTSAHGLMTAAMLTKLNGIAAGAQVNTVTGVKGNGESAYRTGNINITPANIGLGSVNNTADSAKNVLSATKLTTARTINGVSFNGTANITIKADPTDNVLTNQDLNTIKTPGFYSAGGGNAVTNKPTGVDPFGMTVTHNASGIYHSQILHANGSNIYYRMCENDVWSQWYRLYNEAHPQVNITGNAATASTATTATKLSSQRTISLTGAVTGSVSTTLSGAVTIDTAVNHTHGYASSILMNGVSYAQSGNVITISRLNLLSALGASSGTSHGYMSKEDKAKLDQITVSDIGTVGANSIKGSGYIKATIESGIATLTHNKSGVTAGSYGADSTNYFRIPNITVDATGHITTAGYYDMTAANIVSRLGTTAVNRATADVSGNTITSTYYKISGGTLTGVITAKAGLNTDSYSGALNMNDSNIYGVNSIYTTDVSGGGSEGLHFYRDATHVDTIWVNGGNIYFVPNRELGVGTTAANSKIVIHSDNYNNYAPSKTGTGASGTWGISISGNSATATKLATARTIALTGSVTGSGTFDGSGNLSIATTTNHTHAYLPLSGGTLTGDLHAPQAYVDSIEVGNLISTDVSRFVNGLIGNLKGNVTGNTDTATKWATARTFTIGNTAKSVDGTANMSWSLAEIGALPLSGGTLTGGLTIPTVCSNWLLGMTQTKLINFTGAYQGSYSPIIRYNQYSGNVATVGNLDNNFGFYVYKSGRTANGVDGAAYISSADGKFYSDKGFAGSLTGNASTATTASNLTYFKCTSTVNVGFDDTSANAVAYVSGLSTTDANLFGVQDGAIYKQVHSSLWAHEIVGDYITGQISVRGKNNNTWTAWRKILDSTNYTSYTVTKTGSGASGTWGINVTGSSASCTGNAATATKATQDASGNVITTKYVAVDTTQAITGTKTFSALTTHNAGIKSTTGTFSSTLAVSGGSTFTGKTTHNGGIQASYVGASSYVNVNTSGSGTAGGLVLYSDALPINYGIAMRQSSNGGTHGYNNGDWQTYFYMAGGTEAAKRGWIFKNAATNKNVASISQYGDAQFDGHVRIGGNNGCELVYDADEECLKFQFA